MIETDQYSLVFDAASRLFVAHFPGGSSLQLFDGTGRFLRRLGRQGRGPGEIDGVIDVQVTSRAITVFELGGPKLISFDHLGTKLAEAVLSIIPGAFRVVSDTTVLVGSMDRRPSLVGYPLHLVHSRTGVTIHTFGSVDGEFNAGVPFSDRILLGQSFGSTHFWKTSPAAMALEQWSVEGQLSRRVLFDLEWFAPAQHYGGGPRTLLVAFGIDEQSRLLTLTHVPDANWRTAPRHGSEGYILARDLSAWYDTRIDAFDLTTRRHLGSLTWDDAYVGIVRLDSGLGVYRIAPEDPARPRISVLRPEFSRTP